MNNLTQFIKCNLKIHFILLVLALLTTFSNATSLDRRPRGKGTYDEKLKNKDFPFTFIIPDTSDPVEYINVAKQGMQTDTAKMFLLRFIFERYNGISSAGFNKEVVYQKSLKAKLAAFIYMVGLKYETSTNSVISLPAFGQPERELYANEAREILKGISVKGKYFNGIDNQRKRAFELLNYLQAYDYLKTAKSVLQNSNIANESDIREILMDFTYELHAAANNFRKSYSRTNNISLIVAAAVGTSAVIFHREGAGALQIQRHPKRWAHAAHGYIERTLFEGNSWNNLFDEGPMLNKDGVTFYGEGSHYFTYSWQCMLVFIKTYYRAKGIESLTDGSDPGGREYNPCKLCSKVKTESYNSKNYQNLYKGYIESLDQKGWHPALDDTWKPDRRFAPLLALGDNRFTPYFTDFNNITSFNGDINNFIGSGDGQQAFETDILLTQFKGHFEGLPNIVNHDKAGYVALRDTNLYVFLNAERGNNIQGGYHEHGDVGSFEIRAGKNLVPMVFDPYYFGEEGTNREWVRDGYQHNSILIDGDGPHWKDKADYSFGNKNIDWINPDGSHSNYYTMLVKLNYWNRFSQWNMRTAITRELSVIKGYYSYIIIKDDIKNNSLS